MPLFDRVVYHFSGSLAESTRHEIGRILDANGAIEATLNRATHVVSDTIEFEGVDTLKADAVCVTPYWVERSMELGVLQDPKYFLADKDMIFSGVVATSAGIPSGDKEVIIAGIRESGGQWREGLTRDVTHLFVTNTSSQKYETAMHFRSSAHIAILLPQWFDQCWSMQMRLPHDVFEFPDPQYMRREHDTAAYKAQLLVNQNDEKQNILRSLVRMDEAHTPAPAAKRDIWQGRSVILSSSLALDAQRRESVEARISRNGGTVVHAADDDADETGAVDRADVLVTQYRTGAAYAHAFTSGKTIGTLAWLFCVERSGIVTSPRAHLLHYPVRNKPIEGFAEHIITVTNYQGDEREYLKKLIEVMGAKFTPTMSGSNTIVIAAYKSGNKTDKAEEWSVPIVTHKWLEDCFIEWRNLTPARKKYIDYAPGVNYGTVIGQRAVGHVELEDTTLVPENEDGELGRDHASTSKPTSEKKNGGLQEGFTATATSAREVAEVENVLTVGDDVGNDKEASRLGEKPPDLTPVKIGPPRGVKKTPIKTATIKPKPLVKHISGKGKEKEKSPSDEHGGSGDEDEQIIPKPMRRSRTGKAERLERPSSDEQRDSDEDVPRKSRPAPRPLDDKSKLTGGDKTSSMKAKHASAKNVQEGSGEDDPIVEREKQAIPEASVRRVDKEDLSKPNSKPSVGKTSREPSPIVNSDIEEFPRRAKTPPRNSAKSTPKTYQSKKRARAKLQSALPVSDPESEESLPPSPAKKRHALVPKSNHGIAPSPTRVVSVELPSPRHLLKSTKPHPRERTPERKDSRTGSKSTSSPSKTSPARPKLQGPPRTTSIRVAAHEATSVEKVKPGRHVTRQESEEASSRSSSPPPPPKPVSNHPSDASRSSSFPPQVQRTPSRRSAAAAAKHKLRHEVMPDVVNYEKERKRSAANTGRRRKTSSTVELDDDDDESSDDEVVSRPKKRQRVATGKDKGVKIEQEEEEEEEEEDESEGHSSKFVTHVRLNKRSAPMDDVDEPISSKRDRQSGSRKRVRLDVSVSGDEAEDTKGLPRSSCDPKKIRVLTTKVDVREEDQKQLIKLGVKFTTNPAQCTHLVAHSYARTEKFLCALPNIPFVLKYSWLHESSANGIILAECDYHLEDPVMEKKHDFKLTEALERARNLKKKKEKLLQGHFFYFTASVPIDFGLMKNVIKANGGECIQKTPTTRNLSSTRHIISSPEDEKLWRPLMKQGFPIYSSELILTAACAQYVDWGGKSKRVEGSV